MNKESLEYFLARGLDIPYKGIKIKQPKISDIDKVGLLTYYGMTYIFRIQKEHLKLYGEIKDKICGKTLFESIVIQEETFRNKNNFDENNSEIIRIVVSLAFFLGIEDYNRIQVLDNYDIVVYDFKEINNQICRIPILILNNKNFDEFSELIRVITCSSILEIEKEEIDDELEHYDDENLQRLIEEQYRIYKEEKKKEEKENEITIIEVIGSVCMNENSKYNFNNIDNITLWQLHYYFNFLLEKENTEITKSQFTSGNYNFEKVPDLNWVKKTKVKLQKYKNLITE